MEGGAMSQIVHCPACGKALNIVDYVSMMVVSQKTAMFTVRCPECGQLVPSIQRIPASLRPRIEQAAQELHAGMGR